MGTITGPPPTATEETTVYTQLTLSDSTIFNELTSNTYELINNSLTIADDVQLTINLGETLIIQEGKTLVIKGILNNSGIIDVNIGTCYAEYGGVITNNDGGIINVTGQSNEVTGKLYSGIEYQDSAPIDVPISTINNSGTINVNTGTCYAEYGGVINNNAGGIINVTGQSIVVTGKLYSGIKYRYPTPDNVPISTINNSGTITVETGGEFYAKLIGLIDNKDAGKIVLNGNESSKCRTQEGGEIVNNTGASIEVNGGVLTSTQPNSIIINYGTIEVKVDENNTDNYGQCRAQQLGTIINIGTIEVIHGSCYALKGGEIINGSDGSINVKTNNNFTNVLYSTDTHSNGNPAKIVNSGIITVNTYGQCYADSGGEIVYGNASHIYVYFTENISYAETPITALFLPSGKTVDASNFTGSNIKNAVVRDDTNNGVLENITTDINIINLNSVDKTPEETYFAALSLREASDFTSDANILPTSSKVRSIITNNQITNNQITIVKLTENQYTIPPGDIGKAYYLPIQNNVAFTLTVNGINFTIRKIFDNNEYNDTTFNVSTGNNNLDGITLYNSVGTQKLNTDDIKVTDYIQFEQNSIKTTIEFGSLAIHNEDTYNPSDGIEELQLTNTLYFTESLDVSNTYTFNDNVNDMSEGEILLVSSGKTLIINKQIDINSVINNEGTIIITTNGVMNINANGSLNNYQIITINSGGRCFTQGTGEIINNPGAIVYVYFTENTSYAETPITFLYIPPDQISINGDNFTGSSIDYTIYPDSLALPTGFTSANQITYEETRIEAHTIHELIQLLLDKITGISQEVTHKIATLFNTTADETLTVTSQKLLHANSKLLNKHNEITIVNTNTNTFTIGDTQLKKSYYFPTKHNSEFTLIIHGIQFIIKKQVDPNNYSDTTFLVQHNNTTDVKVYNADGGLYDDGNMGILSANTDNTIPSGKYIQYITEQGITSTLEFGSVAVYSTDENALDPICYNKGTKILCLNEKLQDEYIEVEKLRKGDLVKTYLHGYRRIDLIGNGILHNEPNNWGRCMYKMEKSKHDNLLEDLLLTGWHSILVDKMSEEEEKENNVKRGQTVKIDDKYLLLCSASNKFIRIEDTTDYTFYSVVLETDNNCMTTEYGIWANGVLVESTNKGVFLERIIKS